MNRQEKVIEYKHNGSNCCQAVLLAYADILDIPEETLKKLGAALGLGMGGMEGTCGALCGAEMVLGLLQFKRFPILKDAKNIHSTFTKRAGASICKELKGVETGKILCSCDDCVRIAVDILEENRENKPLTPEN